MNFRLSVISGLLVCVWDPQIHKLDKLALLKVLIAHILLLVEEARV